MRPTSPAFVANANIYAGSDFVRVVKLPELSGCATVYLQWRPGSADWRGRRWKTASVAFHESVWLVVGSAAPIIALAAVVSMSDLVKDTVAGVATTWDALKTADFPLSKWEELDGKVNGSVGSAQLWTRIQIGNVFLQAGLLGLSISCLAWQQNFLPPWVVAVIDFVSLLVMVRATYGSLAGLASLRRVARQAERTDTG
jgi:hypothetical protein